MSDFFGFPLNVVPGTGARKSDYEAFDGVMASMRPFAGIIGSSIAFQRACRRRYPYSVRETTSRDKRAAGFTKMSGDSPRIRR